MPQASVGCCSLYKEDREVEKMLVETNEGPVTHQVK